MFEQIGLWLTQFTTGYVVRVSSDLAAALAPIALAWLTIYIANYGYAAARGEVPEPFATFTWKMVKIAFILAFALSGLRYQQIVSATANGMQDAMAAVFLRGGFYDQSAPLTVFGALDGVSNRADDLLKQLWQQAGLTRLDLVAAALVFMVGTAIFLIVGTFVTLLSKVVLTFALAIGPIAILCLMFKPTARFFDSWLSVVLSAIVLSWFVFFALGLSLYVVTETFQGIEASAAFTPGASPTGVSAIGAADGFLVVAVLLAIVLYQAPSLAASFTGGATVQTGLQMISNTLMGVRTGAALARPSAADATAASGGSIQRGAGPAYTAGHALASAYQRVAARGAGR